MSELWEKQDYDTKKSYDLFCGYRDMGIMRSLEKFRIQLGKPERYKQALEKNSSKYHWYERVSAYDKYIEEQTRKENEEKIKEMKERHVMHSMLMQTKVVERLMNLNPSELNANDCSRMYDIAVKIERVSRGCEDNKVEVNNKIVVDKKEVLEQRMLENLTPEELEELERLTKKMNGKERLVSC